jgi:hypothetical protein
MTINSTMTVYLIKKNSIFIRHIIKQRLLLYKKYFRYLKLHSKITYMEVKHLIKYPSSFKSQYYK